MSGGIGAPARVRIEQIVPHIDDAPLRMEQVVVQLLDGDERGASGEFVLHLVSVIHR
jgi:hypothetical protein